MGRAPRSGEAAGGAQNSTRSASELMQLLEEMIYDRREGERSKVKMQEKPTKGKELTFSST